MLLWTMDQMRELQLQWARELYWQEGQARGAIRTCKAMGLDFADALQHLQALLPELPQVNAERLARYYWKEESSANAVAKIDYEIDRRTDREINRVWYGEEYCKSFDEGYINGAVKALAEVIKIYGISLNDSCLQDEADSLNLSLGELRERLDAKMKEMGIPKKSDASTLCKSNMAVRFCVKEGGHHAVSDGKASSGASASVVTGVVLAGGTGKGRGQGL